MVQFVVHCLILPGTSETGQRISSAALLVVVATHAVQGAPAALAGSIVATAVSSAAAAGTATGAAAWTAKLTATIAMTKTQACILAGLTIATAVPLGMQHHLLMQARAEIAHRGAIAPEPLQESFVLTPATEPDPQEEMRRLQQELQGLRAQLAARRQSPAKPAAKSSPTGPTLLVPGRAVPLSDLVFAGTGTPEATVQSLFALQRDAEIEGVFEMMLNPPDDREQQMLATEEGRERAMAALKAEVQDIQSVELLAQKPITETRMQVVIREQRAAAAPRTNTLSLGRTQRGWKITL